MSNLHREIKLENEICEHLAAHGWHYSENDSGYDRGKALYPPDVIDWIQTSQPETWTSIEKKYGSEAEEKVLSRLREAINNSETLHVLKEGFELRKVRGTILMAQFKPSHGLNPALEDRYRKNRLRVMRQVHYSSQNGNSLDLVLFLNGIPVATAELKSDFTQSVEDAISQYKNDRQPNPHKQKFSEPLLTFLKGALVHFAVSNTEVHMTTRLQGRDTGFLPFNQGHEGGAGNPPDPVNGHRTAYLWQTIWQKDIWLNILGSYLVKTKDKNTGKDLLVFPRYHQWDCTQHLLATILDEGPGGKYLIQHSAGSGKTNSIAWTALFLAKLHDRNDKKIFDTVLVVSDRNVLDKQLREAIASFDNTHGFLKVIDDESTSASKTQQLTDALTQGTKIVVCTMQTFPYALEKLKDLALTKGKKFAVIADEAHSSQDGKTAKKLKKLLNDEELKELEDGGEVSSEDLINLQALEEAEQPETRTKNISTIAFTATPKAKTIELFGRLPNPMEPPGKNNLPAPFHVYSMRQAIEEGFILDILQNFQPYNVYFKLDHDGKADNQQEVDKTRAQKAIMRRVRLDAHNIEKKVEQVVEHYMTTVHPLLNHHAKAMVVVSSRLEAVRWQLAMQKYIRAKSYDIQSLAAFSGEVSDADSGPDKFSETSQNLNPTLKGRAIEEAFGTDEFQILIVANKFQTGFDQPLLCAMYVDKPLIGIAAVQTLCRLNRSYRSIYGIKSTTYIVDFVNDPKDILKAFQTWYQTAVLENVSDPDFILDLRTTIDLMGYYSEADIQKFIETVQSNPNAGQADLNKVLDPLAERLNRKYREASARQKAEKARNNSEAEQGALQEMNDLRLFKSRMGSYIKAYAFLSQIYEYNNPAIEIRADFYWFLTRLLSFSASQEDIDLEGVKLSHYQLKSQKNQTIPLTGDKTPTLKPGTEPTGPGIGEPQKAPLTEILEKFNELFGSNLTEDDRIDFINRLIKSGLMESQDLINQAGKYPAHQFAASKNLKDKLKEIVLKSVLGNHQHKEISINILNDDELFKNFIKYLVEDAGLYQELRNKFQENNPEPETDPTQD